MGHKGQHRRRTRESREREAERYRERFLSDPEYRQRRRARRREQSRRYGPHPKHAEYARKYYRDNKHEDLAYLYYSPGLQSHKIGHSTNMRENERVLRRGCWDIQLVDTFPGGRALEKWLHAYFADRRIHPRLEWFRNLSVDEVRGVVARWPGEITEPPPGKPEGTPISEFLAEMQGSKG